MSIQAVASVLESDVGEVAAKMLLVCIANAHNTGTGVCCPSIERLAKESGMSRSSVKRWLRWLADEGFIEVQENRDPNARQLSNSYRIISTSRGSKLTPLPENEPGEGVNAEPLGGANCEPPLKEPEENRKKNGNASARDVLRKDFDHNIWNEFPRNPNSDPSAAFTAFVALSPQERTACMRGVARVSLRFEEAQSDEPLDQRLKFHTHLHTWIKARGWEQELAAA